MIGKGIKNYFINLKYYFIPLGAFALGVVIGLSALVPATVSSVNNLAKVATEISGSASVDVGALFDRLSDAVLALDWTKPADAVRTVCSKEWLGETFHACLISFVPGSETYAAQIVDAVASAVETVVSGFVVLVFFAVLGIIGGYALTKFLVRRNMARRAWWKYFLASFIETLINAAFIVVTAWLRFLWAPGSVIFAVVSLGLMGVAALVEAYILHAWKKLDWRKAVNIKNTGMLLLTDLIILVIAFAAFAALAEINAVVGVFAGLPFLLIALLVMSLNAEAYVKGVVEKENRAAAPAKPEEEMPGCGDRI